MSKKKVIIIVSAVLILVITIRTIYLNIAYKSKEPKEQTKITQETANTEIVTQNEEIEKTEEIKEWKWQKDSPENHNINPIILQNLHNTYDTTQIFSSVIVKDGYIIDEYYKEGYNETSKFILNSASKSITSSLIGIAIDKGYIENENVPISKYFPEIQSSNSEYAKQITIWHLLTHTSGINISDTENWDEWRNSENWVQYIFDAPVTSKPGTVFNYSTTNTHLLCAILQKATGMTAYEFGKKYLFDPIGMESVQCEKDAQGISDGGNGFIMNIYDMLKFGQLYLKDGVWEEEQIISNQWVNASTTLQFKRLSGSANYGYQWWVRTFGTQNYAAYFAQGHAGQYIFVIPNLELVIAFTSNHTGSSSMYWQFVNQIVSAYQE